MRYLRLSLAIAVMLLVAVRFAGAADVEFTDVFVSGESGYAVYRIPALITGPEGGLLAFAEARKNGSADAGDIDLVVKRSGDGGRTWSKMTVIHDAGAVAAGNAVPVYLPDSGRVLLVFTVENLRAMVTHSDDGGKTWAAPRDITASVKKPGWKWYATGPGHGLLTSKGRIVVACDHTDNGVMRSHVILSDDGGETWHAGGTLDRNTDEATAAELSDGSIYINMRSNHYRGMRAVSVSRDGGETWAKIRFDKALVEPVCEGSVLAAAGLGKNGSPALLFTNPASRVREKMTLRASFDDGRTWPVAKLLNEGPSGYSDIAVLADGTIGVLFERGEKQYWEKILLARIRPATLESK